MMVREISLITCNYCSVALYMRCLNLKSVQIYAVLFGMFIAAFSTLRSIILIEIIGLDRLASSLGWTFMFQGIGAILGSPLASIVFEMTRNYGMSFAFSGTILIVAGLFCVPLRCLKRKQDKKDAKHALLSAQTA